MSKKRQIRIDVVYDFADGTHSKSSFDSRRKAVNFTSGVFEDKGVFGGECTIRYCRSYSNAFQFSSYKQFKDVLGVSMEKELLDEYC